MNVFISVFTSAISAAACLVYGSVGEIIGERSGVLNLGLEGVMLIGAVLSYLTAYHTQSLFLAVVVAILSGIGVGLLFAFLTVTLRANQVVCGLALVTFGSGFSGFLSKSIAGTSLPNYFKKIPVPLLSEIPVIGPIFFKQDPLIYALYVLVPAVTVFIYHTAPGLRLRALGEKPGALDAAGVRTTHLRYFYICTANAFVAMGGAYMILAFTPTWTESVTAGNGWIASALVIFSFWNPVLAAVGALFFGFINVFSLRLQLTGIPIPSFFVSMLPYVCTILVLILSAAGFGKNLSKAPSALGKPYDREAR